MTFKQKLIEVISSISKDFQTDELAYLALTSKVELQLRDKIAFKLHEELKDKCLVCREWKPADSNRRIDLAILDKSNSSVLCLIEFKAHSVVRYEEEFTTHLKKDLIKIRDIAETDNVELYYIYFNNVVISGDISDWVYNNSVKYISTMRSSFKKNDNTSEKCIRNWNAHLDKSRLKAERSERITIDAGNYYGLDLTIETFIYGAIKKSEINHLV